MCQLCDEQRGRPLTDVGTVLTWSLMELIGVEVNVPKTDQESSSDEHSTVHRWDNLYYCANEDHDKAHCYTDPASQQVGHIRGCLSRSQYRHRVRG